MGTEKKFILGLGLIFVFLGGLVLGRLGKSEKVLTASVPAATLAPTSTLVLGESIATPSSEMTEAKVIRVVDGDTIEIEDGQRVRYIGIDTPETVDPRTTVQCFGVEASKKNKELVEGKTVFLEKDITDKDKYGRLLRYVWLGPLLVNYELVEKGFAFSSSYPPDIKYQDKFLAAEKEAREVNLGLWRACPISVSPIISPSASPAISAQSTSGQCNIKGNIGASGEKIYHLLGCGSYEKTKIDESRGERFFCSEEEALSAGWRKALNCP